MAKFSLQALAIEAAQRWKSRTTSAAGLENQLSAAVGEWVIVGATVATATGALWAARWLPGADGVGSANDMCEGAYASRRRALSRGKGRSRSYTGSRGPS